MRFSEDDVLVCAECGRTTLRTGTQQSYCRPCSAKRDIERKAKWAQENPAPPPDPAKRRERSERRKELGASASAANRSSMAWVVEDVTEFRQVIRVAVPFSQSFSKNALWSTNGKGHVYIREEIKEIRDDLVGKLRKAGGEWFEGKVWVDIFVEKPNARSDAINVVDLVCDAAKRAIGVDDRWFSIRRLDWSIVKESPRIIVGLAQEVSEHHRACSYCGVVKPLGEFNKNRSGPLGHSRECRDCGRIVRAAKHLDRENPRTEVAVHTLSG
jgi:hypothetical protein